MTLNTCYDENLTACRNGAAPVSAGPVGTAHGPNAMIEHSLEIMDKSDNRNVGAALDVMHQADALFPDNVDVKMHLIFLLRLKGHVLMQANERDQARRHLNQCLSEIRWLRERNVPYEQIIRPIEIEACMDLGEMAYYDADCPLALAMLARTDRNVYPYAAVMTLGIHLEDPGRFARQIADEIDFLTHATTGWRRPFEYAACLYMLSGSFADGVPNVLRRDINHAYALLRKCAEIDPELAGPELKKYSRNLFGKLVYRA